MKQIKWFVWLGVLLIVGIVLGVAQMARLGAAPSEPVPVTAVVATSAEPVKPPVPRFELAVGQELRYELLDGMWIDGPDGKPKIPLEADGKPKYDRSDVTVYVTARNPDDSFRVLLNWKDAWEHQLIYANLFADGKITSGQGGDAQRFREIFPRLPDNATELRDGWQELDEATATLTRYSLDAQQIRAWPESPMHQLSDGHSTVHYRLRPADGLPEQVQSEGYFKFYKETDKHTLELKGIDRHSASWIERFDADARRYFTAVGAQKQWAMANRVPFAVAARVEGAAEEMLDAQRAALAAALKDIEEPLFRSELEKEIKQFDEYRPNRLADAKSVAKFAGLPSPAWKATDLDGKSHSLEQYRGQVVVLDFWFRACGWCIRLMPQMEAASAHFRERQAPVAFLSISTDKKEDDMRAVRDKLNLGSPILRGQEIANVYGIHSFPTLVVIDRQGVVRGFFRGFAESRRDDLTKFVEAILAEKETVPPAGKP